MKNLIIAFYLLVNTATFAQGINGGYESVGKNAVDDFPIVYINFELDSDYELNKEYEGWDYYGLVIHHHINEAGAIDVYSFGGAIVKDDSLKFRIYEIYGDTDKKININQKFIFTFKHDDKKLVLTDEKGKELYFELENN